MKFGIPFIVISRFTLINFQTNPMITVNFFSFVRELLDSPSYVVTKQPNQDIPVYKVKREDGTGPEKTLHRNHLLHLGNKMKEKIIKRTHENNEKRQENVWQKEVAKEGKSNSVTEKPVPRPRKRKDQEKSTTKVIIMDDTIDDDESDIIVISEMAMDNVCEHEVSEEIVSDDGNESETTGAPDSIEEFLNLEDGGDTHNLENNLSHIDEVGVETESNVSVDKDGEENDLSLTVRDEVPEAIASGFVDAERSKTPTIKPPWRSSRVRENPKWQKSGDYCMGISKQVMM